MTCYCNLRVIAFYDGEFQQACDYMVVLGCIECGNMMSASYLAQARINHENIHSSFRPQTMQMYCWIVDLNYLTL